MCFVAAGVRSCLCVNSTCNLASYYDVVIVVVMCVCARERCERAGEREREREREREKNKAREGEKKNSRKLAISRQRKLKDQSRLRAGWLGLLRRDGEADECICMRVCVCVCCSCADFRLGFFFSGKGESYRSQKRMSTIYSVVDRDTARWLAVL